MRDHEINETVAEARRLRERLLDALDRFRAGEISPRDLDHIAGRAQRLIERRLGKLRAEYQRGKRAGGGT